MKPKILSWNVRGCGSLDKRVLIKSSLKQWRPDLVCLQETKLQAIDDFIVRSLWGGSWIRWLAIDSIGASGGILVMWDDRLLQLMDYELGCYSISCLFKLKDEEFSWSFTGVYGPVDNHLKLDFLEEVGAAVFRWNVPWCLGGDFNMVKTMEDKWRCTRRTQIMRLFSDFIHDLQGIDLPLSGCRFTWSNSISKSRLDRFIISNEWEDCFPEVSQKTLPRLLSDHFPILLDGGGLKGGPRPFRFENMWLKVEGFRDMIARWWQGYSIEGTASFQLMKKLSLLKADLRRWNIEEFGRLDFQKAQLTKDIQMFDMLDDDGCG